MIWVNVSCLISAVARCCSATGRDERVVSISWGLSAVIGGGSGILCTLMSSLANQHHTKCDNRKSRAALCSEVSLCASIMSPFRTCIVSNPGYLNPLNIYTNHFPVPGYLN